MATRSPVRITTIVAALFGAFVASLVFGRRVNADCDTQSWVHLKSVTASNGSTTHQAYWPTRGEIAVYVNVVQITTTDDNTNPRAVSTIEAHY